MKALFNLEPALEKSFVTMALLCLVLIAYPQHLLMAANVQEKGSNQALVFEIKDPSLIASITNPSSLTYDQIVENDPLVPKLQDYLVKYNSPLAPYAAEIIKQPQWQRALAISWVESNFGQHCYDNNCSGIGVEPGHPSWRKYATKLDWFKDMSQLLEKPIYKERYTTFEKMRGIYVYPGSSSWVYGAKTKYAELMALEKEANEERQLAAENSTTVITAASQNPELASLTRK